MLGTEQNSGQNIAIARAKLTASWLRQQLKLGKNSKFENNLFDLIDRVLEKCVNETIRPCRETIVRLFETDLKDVLHYLLVLSRDLTKRKRLYILYLLNDTLHHLKEQEGEFLLEADCTAQFSALFQAAWDGPANHRRLTELVEIWRERRYLDANAIDSIWQYRGEERLWPETLSLGRSGQPYYMLPASLMVSHINGPQPIDPDSIKPLSNFSVPLSVVKAAAEFEADLNSSDFHSSSSADSLGEGSNKRAKFTYYGWTHEFAASYKNMEHSTPEPETYIRPNRLNAYPPPASYD